MTDTVQVPREATEEMTRAAEEITDTFAGGSHGYFCDVWEAMLAAAPQATDPRDEIGCCDGCGSTKSMAQIHAENPRALSCCPERKMLTAKQWSERALAAESRIATLTAERDALREALKLLHDNIVQAFPSLANLGPVAQARALTTQPSKTETRE